MPVEFFNPLRNVTVSPNLDLEEIGRQAHTLGELVGLALRGISDCPMELNLRPASVVKRHRLAEQRPYFITAGICLLLALGGTWLYFQRAAEIKLQVVEALEPKVNSLRTVESRMNSVKAEIKKQEEVAAPLLQALGDRQYWVNVLNDLNSRLPADYVWVTAFAPELAKPEAPTGQKKQAAQKPNPSGATSVSVTLSGLYLTNPLGPLVVDDFIKKLGESPLYEVDKEKLLRSVPNDTEWAYDWSVPLTFKNPISLQ